MSLICDDDVVARVCDDFLVRVDLLPGIDVNVGGSLIALVIDLFLLSFRVGVYPLPPLSFSLSYVCVRDESVLQYRTT